MALKTLITTAVAIALPFLLAPMRAQAQDETPKLELGMQFAPLGLDGAHPRLIRRYRTWTRREDYLEPQSSLFSRRRGQSLPE
jgi:hypothetical protein